MEAAVELFDFARSLESNSWGLKESLILMRKIFYDGLFGTTSLDLKDQILVVPSTRLETARCKRQMVCV